MRTRTAVIAATTAGALGGLVVGGAALTGVAASGSPSSDASTSAAPSRAERPCGAMLDRLPDGLKQDLLDARKQPAGPDRMQALKEIRKNARAGEYGDKAQRFADRRRDHRGEVWKRLPSDLRADLKDLRGLDPDDRWDAIQDVRKSALAGDYGDKVQQLAERRQERRETCHPGQVS